MMLTDPQRMSLDIDSSIAVTAGAGSGKTRVLVERYISILKGDRSIMPRNILALTFTDKAASQMKDRIRRSIKEILPEDPKRWSRVLDDLESSDISTIHAFCTKLVRSDPIPCGLDPDFRVITETESREMLRLSLNRILTVEGPESDALRRLLVDMGMGTTTRILISMIRERSRTDLAIGSPEFKEISLNHLTSSWEQGKKCVMEEIEPIVDTLRDLGGINVPDFQRDTAVPLMNALKPAIRSAEEEIGIEDIIGSLNSIKDLLLTRSRKERSVSRLGNSKVWGKDHARLKEAFSRIFRFVYKNQHFLQLISKEDLRSRAKERLGDILEVYTALEKGFTRSKRNANGIDFDDQISLSLDLLEGASPNLLGSLRRRYNHLLVDEFQDTDPRQWRIVELLWNEGKTSKLFIVGDPKQSIYGFRSADVRLFLKAKSKLEEHQKGKCIVLDRNFRSRREIMSFVNEIFPDIMEEEGSRWSVDFDPLDPHKGDGGSITVVGVTGYKGSESREGAQAAKLIKRAVRGRDVLDDDGERPLMFRDIAILLPTRKGFKYYEDALRAENIPYQVYKGKGFFERQEVKDVLDLLRFLCDPGDDLSLASVLKGPFFGLSDEELLEISASGRGTMLDRLRNSDNFRSDAELLDTCLEISSSLVPYRALHRILEKLDAHALMGGARGSGNLDRLVDWSMEERSAGSLQALKERLQRLVDEPPTEGEPPLRVDDDSVTVMTVHAAKGLEWPMVLVLGMNHEPKVRSSKHHSIDPEKGLSIKVADTTTGELVKTPSFMEQESDLDDKEYQERKRLFYVACTRAKDHLVLSGKLPLDASGREKEPHGMIKLLWEGMDLSLEDLETGVKVIGDLPIELITVSPEDLLEEEDEYEVMETDLTFEEAGTVDIPGSPGSKKKTFLKSPSSLLRTDDEKRGFPLRYPDLEGDIPPEVMGDMVHAVLQGIPLERTIREKGYPDSGDRVKLEVERIRTKMDEMGLKPLGSEVEVVGELDGDLILGRMDLVARDSRGRLHIIDHKTGKIKKRHLDQVKIYKKLLGDVVEDGIETSIISSKE